MEKKIELLPPMMPNFINIKMPPRPRDEGFVEAPKLSVADLSREEAEAYAELMKKTFLDHWKSKVSPQQGLPRKPQSHV